MDGYRPVDQQLIDACREYPPDFAGIQKILSQGADVNAISSEDPDRSVITEIIYCYPEIIELQAAACPRCEDEDCSGCSLYAPHADGRYLPQIIQLLLENGFDAAREDGIAGARALLHLIWSSQDKYILDSCKLLLRAGADPTLCPYPGDPETVLTAVAGEASFQFCERNLLLGNLYETMYQIMKAASKGWNFEQIHLYDLCVGRQIDSVTLCSEEKFCKGIFASRLPGLRRKAYFQDTILLSCENVPLCISPHLDLIVNPNLSQRTKAHKDLTSYFQNCIGHTIIGIDLTYTKIRKNRREYSLPSILIRLDNGKSLRFTLNRRTNPKRKDPSWFQIEKSSIV